MNLEYNKLVNTTYIYDPNLKKKEIKRILKKRNDKYLMGLEKNQREELESVFFMEGRNKDESMERFKMVCVFG